MSADARARASALKLYGVLAHWQESVEAPWLEPLLQWEELERARRSLERRLRYARIGRFKALVDFDWHWPAQIDQRTVAELMGLEFLASATNVILVGPAGVGKTTIAQNIAHQAVIAGHTVRFASAGRLLGDLASLDSDSPPRRPALRADQPAPREEKHPDHHQQGLLGMGRGLPERQLRGGDDRSAGAPCRNPRRQGRILSPQGSPGACRQQIKTAPEQKGRDMTMTDCSDPPF